MKQIKLGIILNYLTILITFGIGLIYTPFLIKTLGQEEYGIYALAFSVAGYFSLMDLGIGNSIVRYVSANMVEGTKESEKRLVGFFLKVFIFIGFITLTLGFLLAFNIGDVVSSEFSSEQIRNLKYILIILTLNFALGFIMNTFSSVLMAYEKIVFLKISNILRSLITTFISFLLLVYMPSSIGLVLILFIVNFIMLSINFIYYKFIMKLNWSFKGIDKDYKKEILGYSIFIFIVVLADKFYWQTDQILLGIFKSPNDVAIYAVAMQFIVIFQQISVAVINVFLPHITKLSKDANYLEKLNNLYIRVSKFQVFIVGLAFSGFIVLGKSFLILWVGAEYSIVYFIVIILLSPFFIDLIQNLGITIMQAQKRYRFRAYTLITCAILNLIVSIFIIEEYNVIGLAIVTAIFVFIGNVLLINIYLHSKMGLNMFIYWKEIGRILVLLVPFVSIIFYTFNEVNINSWGHFFSSALVYMFFYVIYFIFIVLKVEDRAEVFSRLNKRK